MLKNEKKFLKECHIFVRSETFQTTLVCSHNYWTNRVVWSGLRNVQTAPGANAYAVYTMHRTFEQRCIIKFLVKPNKSAVDTFDMIRDESTYRTRVLGRKNDQEASQRCLDHPAVHVWLPQTCFVCRNNLAVADYQKAFGHWRKCKEK